MFSLFVILFCFGYFIIYIITAILYKKSGGGEFTCLPAIPSFLTLLESFFSNGLPKRSSKPTLTRTQSKQDAAIVIALEDIAYAFGNKLMTEDICLMKS